MSNRKNPATPNIEKGPNQNVYSWDEIGKKCFHRRDIPKEITMDTETGKIRRKKWPKSEDNKNGK